MKGYLSVFINEEEGIEGKLAINRGYLPDFDYCIELYADDNENYLDSIENSDALDNLGEKVSKAVINQCS